jgi:hypothetical protein
VVLFVLGCHMSVIIFFMLQISRGLSDGLLSNNIGPHSRGLVPVLEEDQDMEEGIQRQMGIYGNGRNTFLVII